MEMDSCVPQEASVPSVPCPCSQTSQPPWVDVRIAITAQSPQAETRYPKDETKSDACLPILPP